MKRFKLLSIVLIFIFSFQTPNYYEVKFFNKVCLEFIGQHEYKLCHNFAVGISDGLVFIPYGFESDLATIPKVLWNVIAPDDQLIVKAALLHDFLYHTKKLYSRREADEIFYQALIENKVSKPKALFLYYVVRFCSSAHYKGN